MRECMVNPIRVVVWNEFRHERKSDAVREIYPVGIHETIAAFLRQDAQLAVSTATLDEPQHGLSEARLAETDVLVWWSHLAHGDVSDAVVDSVVRRVHEGMGLVVLHSGHFSKPFKRLMGTTCDLKWREGGDKERLWVVDPGHPIVAGIGEYIEIPHEEMYGEHFDIPAPDELVLISWFTGGEVFRSGCTFKRGAGRIFYFRPGHETCPTYHQAGVQQILRNGVRWTAPTGAVARSFGNAKSLE